MLRSVHAAIGGRDSLTENSPTDQIDAIASDAAWFPYRVLDQGRTLRLMRLPRDKLDELIFLDNRVQEDRWDSVTAAAPRFELPAVEMADRGPRPHPGSCHFIFHSAFCGSTLMARALDVKGIACVLREPRALHELGLMKPGSKLPDQQRVALEVVLDMMQRPRIPGEKTIIKPANTANPLIEYIMEYQPNSRALLMYLSLPDFILAIARGRRWSWARNLAVFYRNHLEFETQQTRDLLRLTDLQMAAFLWLQQQAQFARLASALPAGRVATLRLDEFVAQPAEAIAAAAAFFDLPLRRKEADAIVAGPLFQKHSKKTSQSYDESARKRDDALVKLAFGPEIEQATQWGHVVAAEASVPLELRAPLIR